MNILHLVSYAVFSGPLPPTLQLALAQKKLGHTVWLVHNSLRGAFSPFEEGADGVMASSGLRPPVALGLCPKAGLRQLWRDRSALVGFIRQHRVDVVHTHLSHDHALVALAGLAGQVRRVHTVHATRQLARRPWRTWLWRHTDAVVLRHDHDAPLLTAACGQRQLRTATIPASIDAQLWYRPHGDGAQAQAHSLRVAWGVAPDAPLMVHVALMANRGQRELLLAWAIVHRIWRQACQRQPLPALAFVGDGPDRTALQKLSAELGIADHVFFPGYIAHSQLAPVYWAANGAFLAQPGNDGGARAALEAMAAKVPLVAVSKHPVLAELLAKGGGFDARSRDPADIAKATMSWLASPGLGQNMAERACDWVSQARGPATEAEAALALYRG